MTNIEHLRMILKEMELEKTDEALEFLDEIEEEINAANDEIKNLEAHVRNIKNELNGQPDLESVNLGLDTIHFYFEKGNLLVRQKFDRAMSAINTIPHAIT
jgi:hypothetical protein